MPWSVRFEPPGSAAWIQVSMQARELIGPENIREFVRLLSGLMEALGAYGAYVGKAGRSVSVEIFREDGWRGRTKLPVKK